MKSKALQRQDRPSLEEYNHAQKVWTSFMPPYSMHELIVYVTASKTILDYLGQNQLSKYEVTNNLRILFTHTGRVVFRT